MSAWVSVTARGVSSKLTRSFSERSQLLVPQRLLRGANVRHGVCHSLCYMPTSDEFEAGGRPVVAGFYIAQLLGGVLETAEVVFTDEHSAIDVAATGNDDLAPTMRSDRLKEVEEFLAGGGNREDWRRHSYPSTCTSDLYTTSGSQRKDKSGVAHHSGHNNRAGGPPSAPAPDPSPGRPVASSRPPSPRAASPD